MSRNTVEVASSWQRRRATENERIILRALKVAPEGLTVKQLMDLDVYTYRSLMILLKRWTEMGVLFESRTPCCSCERPLRRVKLRPSVTSEDMIPTWK